MDKTDLEESPLEQLNSMLLSKSNEQLLTSVV